MADRWTVVVNPGRSRLVPYGPSGDRLPAKFTATIGYDERPIQARLAASFDGVNRVRVDAVTVERTDGQSVTPEDMTALQLAQAVHAAVDKAAKRGPGVTRRVDVFGPERAGPPTEDDLQLLARMYWHEYVSWGNPRQAVMLGFIAPRSTANQWIRKARDLYGLPGPHANSTDEED